MVLTRRHKKVSGLRNSSPCIYCIIRCSFLALVHYDLLVPIGQAAPSRNFQLRMLMMMLAIIHTGTDIATRYWCALRGHEEE